MLSSTSSANANYHQSQEDMVISFDSLFIAPDSVGVLAGEDLAARHTTCTWDIASKRFPNAEIVGYPSFERAVDGLKGGLNETVLVPAAYPKLHELIMDKEIRPYHTFLEAIPYLVFATKSPEYIEDKTTTIYLHPAPRKLADKFIYTRIEECSSNERVCHCLLNDNDAFAAAITNEVAAKHFKLHIHKLLHQPNMPWILFTKC